MAGSCQEVRNDARRFGWSQFEGVIVEALTRFGSREAFIEGGQRLTYARCAELVSQFQQVLHELGIGVGATVVALSPNVPEVFLTQVAAWLNGARYSGLHPMGSVEDHIALCDDAGASVLLAHPDYAETAVAVAGGCPAVRRVLFLGDSDAGQNLLTRASAFAPRRLRPPQARASDTVWMLYTGGTTGRSKAVLHGHRSMVQGMLGIASAWALPQTPRYLACGPITHASILPIVPTLARGGTVVLNRGFDPERWLDTIARERVNYSFIVPTMLYTLLDRCDPAPSRSQLAAEPRLRLGAGLRDPAGRGTRRARADSHPGVRAVGNARAGDRAARGRARSGGPPGAAVLLRAGGARGRHRDPG